VIDFTTTPGLAGGSYSAPLYPIPLAVIRGRKGNGKERVGKREEEEGVRKEAKEARKGEGGVGKDQTLHPTPLCPPT